MPDTTIVIPCYNEAQRLDVEAFGRYALQETPFRFLLVDDGSADSTLETLRDLESLNPDRFQVLPLAKNRGKAEAVRQGVLKALQDDPFYVGYWDADLATPLAEIARFRSLLESRSELDLVLGSRVRMLGRTIERKPLRAALGRLFAAAASAVLGLPVYDTQCGAKLFRNREMTRQIFADPFVTNWIFDVELIARMIRFRHARGFSSVETSIYELPLESWRDVGGSKVRPRDFFKAGFELLAIRRRYLRNLGDAASDETSAPKPDAVLPQRRAAKPVTAAEPIAVGK